MERIYKYAVIRATPDRRKGEVVNIGILVFHPDTVDTRLAPSLNKLLALDASIDVEEIRSLPTVLGQWASRFDSVEEKYEAIRHFGVVTLSEVGTFRTTPALGYQDQVSNLLKTLVLPKQRDEPSVSINRISTSLREVFRQRDVLGKETEDIHRHLVVPNYPINADENLYSDFALKNGAYWFTETADFRAKSRGALDNMRVASFAAIKLLKAKKLHRNVHTFVVYATSRDADLSGQINLLSTCAGEIIDIDDRKAMARYTQQILEVAGSNKQIDA